MEALAAQVDNWVQHENQEPVREAFETLLWELSRQGRVQGLHWEATGVARGAEVMHIGLAEGLKTSRAEIFREGQEEGRKKANARVCAARFNLP